MDFRRRATGSLFAVGLLVIAGCGGSDAVSGNDERPLELAEAASLANALFDNYDRGGASFTYTGRLGDDVLILEGDIDFVTHRGRARVTATGPESAVTEVVWSDTEVIERIPSLGQILIDAGLPAVEWTVREPRIDGRELDAAIALIVGLASEQRDNPQLILQEEGSAFLRRQEHRGADVEVLRFGQLTSYWIDSDSGELLRFDGNNSNGTRPRVVDLRDFGARVIEPPPRDDVARADLIDEMYQAALVAG